MNSKKENLWSKVSTFLVFAGPATFSFLAVVIVPFLYGVYLTFTSWDGVSSNKPFVGLKNYAAVVADSSFWQSLGLTLLYVVVSVILVNVVGFLLALLVTGKIKGKNFFRAGFFTPNLIGGIILGYIWQFVFNKVIVYFGDALNVTVLQKSMLSGSASAFAALVLVTIWQFSGYMMLIYIAGLTGVSEDLKEAAKIDGCNESQTDHHQMFHDLRCEPVPDRRWSLRIYCYGCHVCISESLFCKTVWCRTDRSNHPVYLYSGYCSISDNHQQTEGG